MAKLRSVNVKFWDDDYICELPPDQKLLFLYLLTNRSSNIAGVYELARRQIIFDTCLTAEQVAAGLAKFAADRKVIYERGYIFMLNHHKNQNLNQSMETARRKLISNLPAFAQEIYFSYWEQDADTMRQDEDTMVVSCTQLEYKDKVEYKEKEELKEKIESAKAKVAERYNRFLGEVFIDEYRGKYGEKMLTAFTQYWCEQNPARTKMRFELEKTWELPRRLATWASREKVLPGRPAEVLTYNELMNKVQREGPQVQNDYHMERRGGRNVWILNKIEDGKNN